MVKKRKVTPRGKTERFSLDEVFIFGAPRCIKCGKVLKDLEAITCDKCDDE